MRRFVYIMACVLSASAVDGIAQVKTKYQGCLYSNANAAGWAGAEIAECADALGVGKAAPIKYLLRTLDIDASKVEFHGCKGAPFMTRVRVGIGGRPDRYQVFYPTEGHSNEDLVAPEVAHELGHVYQLASHGGFVSKESDDLIVSIVELSADFPCGTFWTSEGIARTGDWPLPPKPGLGWQVRRERSGSASPRDAFSARTSIPTRLLL